VNRLISALAIAGPRAHDVPSPRRTRGREGFQAGSVSQESPRRVQERHRFDDHRWSLTRQAAVESSRASVRGSTGLNPFGLRVRAAAVPLVLLPKRWDLAIRTSRAALSVGPRSCYGAVEDTRHEAPDGARSARARWTRPGSRRSRSPTRLIASTATSRRLAPPTGTSVLDCRPRRQYQGP